MRYKVKYNSDEVTDEVQFVQYVENIKKVINCKNVPEIFEKWAEI